MSRFLPALMLALAFATPSAADNGLVTKPSRYGVAETLDRFEALVKQEKFQVFARVDFQALAAANGGNVRASQILLFGRGGILPPLLPAAPTVAVDLPLKMLAWEDKDGKVWLTWNTGEYLKARHDIAGKDELLARLTGVIAGYAAKAAD